MQMANFAIIFVTADFEQTNPHGLSDHDIFIKNDFWVKT